VLAASHESLVHQHTNIGHLMKSYGSARRDHITGCVLATAMPSFGSMEIPESAEAAARLTVLAVMFKQAQGVPQLLGQHQSGRQQWACSAEIAFAESELGIWDPGDASITMIGDVKGAMGKALTRDDNGTLHVGQVKGRQLAFALGGVSDPVTFRGLANTPTPAEDTAKINEIRAMDGSDYQVMAAGEPEWYPGVRVLWHGFAVSCHGEGVIRAVHYSGERSMHCYTFTASATDPVLEVELPSGTLILRKANGVRKAP